MRPKTISNMLWKTQRLLYSAVIPKSLDNLVINATILKFVHIVCPI